MLHKVSSTKCLNHSNFHSPSAIINWENIRKEKLSPRQTGNNQNNSTGGNMNEKIARLFKIIEQEKSERKKDFLALNEKIKSIKCKHPVVVVDSKQQMSKSSSMKTVDSLGFHNTNIKNTANDVNQIYRHDSMIQNRSKELQQKIMSQLEDLKRYIGGIEDRNEDSHEKWEKFEERVQQLEQNKNEEIKYAHKIEQKINEMSIKLEILGKQCKQIENLKCKLEENTQINREFQKNKQQVNLSQFNEMKQKLAQLQQHINESLKQVQERGIKNLSTLGEIVSGNLQTMHKTITDQMLQVVNTKFTTLTEENMKNRVIQAIVEEQKNYKNVLEEHQTNALQSNQKIREQIELISIRMEEYSSKIANILSKVDSHQSLAEKNSIETNPSITIGTSQKQINPQNMSTGQMSMKKIQQNFDQKLSEVMELVEQNCTYLETRNQIIEQNVADVVQVINNLLAKFKKYV